MKQAKAKYAEQQGEVDAQPEIGRERVSLMDVTAWSHRYKCAQVLHCSEDNTKSLYLHFLCFFFEKTSASDSRIKYYYNYYYCYVSCFYFFIFVLFLNSQCLTGQIWPLTTVKYKPEIKRVESQSKQFKNIPTTLRSTGHVGLMPQPTVCRSGGINTFSWPNLRVWTQSVAQIFQSGLSHFVLLFISLLFFIQQYYSIDQLLFYYSGERC